MQRVNLVIHCSPRAEVSLHAGPGVVPVADADREAPEKGAPFSRRPSVEHNGPVMIAHKRLQITSHNSEIRAWMVGREKKERKKNRKGAEKEKKKTQGFCTDESLVIKLGPSQ